MTCTHNSTLPSKASFSITHRPFLKIQSVFPRKTALINEKLTFIHNLFTCEYKFLLTSFVQENALISTNPS